MKEDTEVLDEVVVTALGIKRSQKALSYNVQEVKGDALTAPTELRLMSKLSDFPTALANGTEDLSPLALVTYLKELAADFHSFYNAERVLVDDEKLRNARLALLVATRQVLRNGLEILGVSAPERLSRADQPADSTK